MHKRRVSQRFKRTEHQKMKIDCFVHVEGPVIDQIGPSQWERVKLSSRPMKVEQEWSRTFSSRCCMACAGTALRKVQTADSLRESSRKFSAENSRNIYGSVVVQLRRFEPVCSWFVIHQVLGSIFYDKTNKIVSGSGVRCGANVRNRPSTTVTQKCTVGSRIWPTHLSDDSYGTLSFRKYLSLFCFIWS